MLTSPGIGKKLSLFGGPQYGVGKLWANVAVEVTALGIGLEQFLIRVERHARVLANAPIPKFDLHYAPLPIVGHLRYRGRFHRYAIG